MATWVGTLGCGGTDLLVGAPRAGLRLPRRLRLRPGAICGECKTNQKGVAQYFKTQKLRTSGEMSYGRWRPPGRFRLRFRRRRSPWIPRWLAAAVDGGFSL